MKKLHKTLSLRFIPKFVRNYYQMETGEYVYKPWAFDTILIYLYMCVILVFVNISDNKICLNQIETIMNTWCMLIECIGLLITDTHDVDSSDIEHVLHQLQLYVFVCDPMSIFDTIV